MLQISEIKYKFMTIEELYRNLERLTRVIEPESKFLRVFNSIILKNVLSPKFNLKSIEKLTEKNKCDIVELIWNSSVKKLLGKSLISSPLNIFLNDLLKKEEKNIFVFDTEK